MRTRTATRIAALIVPLAVLAAACTSGDDSSSDTTAAGPTTSAAPATTAAPDSTAPAAEPEFDLGVLVPPPGLTSELFTAQLRGVGFAQSDIDGGGGVLGAPLGVSEQQIPLGGTDTAAASEAVSAGADALLGPVSSAAATDLVPSLQALESAACSASATAPYATAGQEAGLVFFRTVIPDQFLTAELSNEIVAARDAAAPGAAWKVAIVARSDAYGQNVGGGLASLLEAAGLAPTVIGYNPNAVIFDETAKAVAAVQPDFTVLVTYEEGARLLASLVGAGLPAKAMLGLDSFFIPRLTDVVGGDPADLEGFNVFGTPGDNAFLNRLVTEDPRGQVAYAAQAYDCTVVLALAAAAVQAGNAKTLGEAAQTVTSGGRTCSTYADCLAKLDAGEDIDYDGVSGNLGIDSVGNPTWARYTNGQVRDGSLVQVASRDVDIARESEIAAVTTSAAFTTQLQIALKLLGFYTGPVDGIYSAELTAAVAAFQTSVGLPPTGIYDAATDAALRARATTINDLLGATTADLQRALTDLGYYDGPIDGVWSPALTASIRALQADLGVPQTGVLDVATVRAIYQQGVTTGATTTTVPPTTAAPTTVAPTTAPPTTAAPETTAPPVQTTAPPAETTAPPVDTTVAQPEPPPSIFEVLKANDQFSCLVGLLSALYPGGSPTAPPVTFFAPTDEALSAVGISGDGCTAVPEDKADAYRQILENHVVLLDSGAVYVVEAAPPGVRTEPIVLEEPQVLNAWGGGTLAVTGSGATVQVGGANITLPNLVASNGIVQGVDQVLPAPEPR